MRVTTFNVNSLNARVDQLARFCSTYSPDVLCLQETKVPDDRFPHDVIASLGYEHCVFTGQKGYNGVAMLSRHPIADPQTDFLDGEPHPDRRLVAGTVQGVRIYGLYCPNGTEVGSDRFFAKLAWFERLRAELHAHHRPDAQLMLVGDFNITPTDNDTWDPFRSEGQLLCTDEERGALEALLAFGLYDAWREHNPFSVEFSWWDYQRMGWSRNHGLRIDHALVTAPVLERTESVTIHKEVRGWDSPSDHAPVSIELR